MSRLPLCEDGPVVFDEGPAAFHERLAAYNEGPAAFHKRLAAFDEGRAALHWHITWAAFQGPILCLHPCAEDIIPRLLSFTRKSGPTARDCEVAYLPFRGPLPPLDPPPPPQSPPGAAAGQLGAMKPAVGAVGAVASSTLGAAMTRLRGSPPPPPLPEGDGGQERGVDVHAKAARLEASWKLPFWQEQPEVAQPLPQQQQQQHQQQQQQQAMGDQTEAAASVPRNNILSAALLHLPSPMRAPREGDAADPSAPSLAPEHQQEPPLPQQLQAAKKKKWHHTVTRSASRGVSAAAQLVGTPVRVARAYVPVGRQLYILPDNVSRTPPPLPSTEELESAAAGVDGKPDAGDSDASPTVPIGTPGEVSQAVAR